VAAASWAHQRRAAAALQAHNDSQHALLPPSPLSPQEENLFVDLAAIITRMQQSLAAWTAATGAASAPSSQPQAPAEPAAAPQPLQEGGVADARELVLQLRRMCAAVRASLETHVRAEEAELWPLFAEHFTFEEQQHLVGVIIGRTGAEVLQALLPWVTGSFSEEEAGAMMESLRAATRNTSFDQWLGATMSGAGIGPGGGSAGGGSGGADAAAAAAAAAQQEAAAAAAQQRDVDSSLAEVAEYLLAAPPPAGSGAPATPSAASAAAAAAAQAAQQQQQQQQQEASGTVAESSSFRPGWEEIFNINQKQLEAAIRRVSNDPGLEPQRKAYIIQNIMVSRCARLGLGFGGFGGRRGLGRCRREGQCWAS
jgi:hypothetical protein